ASVYALLSWHSVLQLLSVYIWLRIATSVLTVLAAWWLRRTRPEMERAFKIPWGKSGLAYAVIAPLIVSAIAIIVPAFSHAPADRFALRWGPPALLIRPLAYLLFHRRRAIN